MYNCIYYIVIIHNWAWGAPIFCPTMSASAVPPAFICHHFVPYLAPGNPLSSQSK